MSPFRLNFVQRIVLSLGLGGALYVLGQWLTLRRVNTGWTAYAPLRRNFDAPSYGGGLHPWVQLVVWIVLLATWVGVSLYLFRTRDHDGGEQTSSP